MGKSTLFKALTLADTEIGAFPFTTIKANIGVGYVRTKCECIKNNTVCNPKNGVCRNGIRYSPTKLIDVAGLVPGAHEGKGLGNQFLDDLRQADALIHVVDISGNTNEAGEACKNHDPEKDILFLIEEVDQWFGQIVEKNYKKISNKIRCESNKIEVELCNVLSGLGVNEAQIKNALDKSGLSKNTAWSSKDCFDFAKELRMISKPIMIAANKVDSGFDNYMRLKDKYDMTPVCAEAELALREADINGLIEYIPGDSSFKVLKEIDGKKKAGLDFIKSKILEVHGSTGVQSIINSSVFEKLDMILVYPVENESKLSDTKGNVLPDSILLKNGATVLDLAYKIHSDIGDKFVSAIDCKKKMKVAKNHKLATGDIIKIHSRA